jgi:N-acyl-phosphatidylethanolamine-hydrolysing phospholipase D
MEVLVKWVGGATVILTIGNLKIAIDPVLCDKGTVQDYFWFKSTRIEQPIYHEDDFENIDLWLITHNHEDHIDSKGKTKISKSSKIISNQNALRVLKDISSENLSVLHWHDAEEFELKDYTIEVEAIPAVHGVNPLSAFFAGRGNGYYLTVMKGDEQVKIYFTGDTVYKKRIIRSLRNRSVDMMVANMGAAKQGSWIMTLTLDAEMLQKMIAELDPTMVLPVHYGTFAHYREPAEKMQEIEDERIKMVAVGGKMKWSSGASKR